MIVDFKILSVCPFNVFNGFDTTNIITDADFINNWWGSTNSEYNIHSISRDSDGVVFKIGDMVFYKKASGFNPFHIGMFISYNNTGKKGEERMGIAEVGSVLGTIRCGLSEIEQCATIKLDAPCVNI